MKKYLSIWIALVIMFSAHKSSGAEATAVIKGTTPGSQVSGRVTFQDSPEGLKVKAEVDHVSPGKHGFHIHEFGSCADEGKAAGGHFNPDKVSHGLLAKDGFSHAHAGDLGNIEVALDGKGKLDTTIPHLSLAGGKYGIAGKSVVLHEKEDDLTTQPAGNAGARIGCGTVESGA